MSLLSEITYPLLITLCIAGIVALPLLFLCHGRVRLGHRKAMLLLNLGLFVVAVFTMVLGSGLLYAAEVVSLDAASDNISYGMAYIAAALATGIGSLGAGLAVAAAAPAAIGALTEDASTFGKAMIFVGLGEGLAIFGLLVSILILQKIP